MTHDSSRRARLLRRFAAVFDALPPLDSDAFRSLIRSASLDDLPAQVLLRAFVELDGRGPSADLILNRLLEVWGPDDDPGPHAKGYLAHVYARAERRVEDAPSPYSAAEYVSETGRQILRALRTECKHARKHGVQCRIENWYRFCEHRFLDALNVLDGKVNKKTRQRTKVARLRALPDPTTGQPVVENVGGDGAAWHGNSGPSVSLVESEDLVSFLRSALAASDDELMVAVAEHLWFGDDPPPISNPDADGRPPLTEILGTTRDKVRHARDRARRLIRAAVYDEFGPTSAMYRLVERLTTPPKPRHHV